jgi:asparagine synthase (glutamine-hydrolysing)
MCGIAGSFHPEGRVCDESVMVRMRDRMSHRGPDGCGLWVSSDHRCRLAHRRLSIIDLSDAAAQPMTNHAGTVAVTFNGEIYNHADIRRELQALGKYVWKTDHSDTEVLLHAYEEWGLDCVHRLYGMFALAIYDARDPGRPVLHLIRDRVGVKPMYFARTNRGEWLFASEIRAIVAHPDVTPEMDGTAFWHYLTFIVAPAPLTMFRGVFKLPAGHILSIDHTGRGVARQFWDCAPDRAITLSPGDISEPEAVAELTRLLRQSIARRMVSDVPFGVLLSGGVDSSMNVALMSELMDRPVSTFTIGYEGKEDYNEFQYARRISQRYKTDHHETLINQDEMQDFLPLLVRLQDEPIADNVCIPLYFLAKLVKDSGTTVVQVGEGADENFLGYWWCEHYRQLDELCINPAPAPAGLAPHRRGPEPSACFDVDRSARGAAAGAPWRGTVLGRRRLLVGTEARAAHARSPAVRAAHRLSGRGPRACEPPLARQSRSGPRVRRPSRRPARRTLSAAEDAIPGDEASPVRASVDARRQADHGPCGRGARSVSRS